MGIPLFKTNRLKKSTLIKSGIWYTFGNFFVKGITFLTIPIYARILPVSDYGLINIYNTYLMIVTIFVSFGLVGSIGRAELDFREDYNQYLSSILFLSTLIFIGFIVITSLFKQKLSSLIGLQEELILLILIHAFSKYIIDFISSKFKYQNKYKSFLLVAISTTVLSVILSIYLITSFTNEKYLGKIYSDFVIFAIFSFILYTLTVFKGKKLINKTYWKYALIISIPLIPHNLSGLVLSQIDRIMINSYLGTVATGIYSFAYNIGLISSVIMMSLNSAWVPWFYKKMAEKKYLDIEMKTKNYVWIFSLLTFILIYLSPEVISLLGTKEYFESIDIVPIIMVSYYFNFLYTLPVNYEFYSKKTYFISIGSIITAVINIVLNMLLIPRMGFLGAAWSTLLSYTLIFFIHYIIVDKIIKFKLDLENIIYSIVFILITTVFFYLIKDNILLRYGVVVSLTFYLLKKMNGFGLFIR